MDSRCVVWVDGPFGTRLATYLATRHLTAVPVGSLTAATAALETPSTHFIGLASGEVLAAHHLWAAVPHRALLIGQQDPTAFREWEAQGVAILSGPLPHPVADWLDNLDGGPAWEVPQPALDWTDSPRPASTPPPRIIVTSSTAGGVGKTTTASLLARLAAEQGARVTLVEADEDKSGLLRLFGHAPATQGLDTISSILWNDPAALFPAVAECAVTVPVRPGTVTIYPMVGRAEGLVLSQPDSWAGLLRHLADSADLVLVDLPPRFRDVLAFTSVQVADCTVLVYEPTEINLDAYIKHVTLAQELDLDVHRFRLVLNRVTDAGLDPGQFTACVPEVPLVGVIPENPVAYRTYVNTGRLVLDPTSPWRDVYRLLTSGAAPSSTAPALTLGRLPPSVPTPVRVSTAKPAEPAPFWRRVLGLS